MPETEITNPMRWTRRDDGSYVSDAGYVIRRNGPYWVSNRSDTEPVPGWNSHSKLAFAKTNCEQDRRNRANRDR